VRGQLDAPLAIRDLKRFALEQTDVDPRRAAAPSGGGRVGVIGGGPCGLAVASFLAGEGLSVTVFDRAETPGGMVAATIPGFRADLRALEQDVKRLRRLGVTFELGRGVTVPELRGSGFDWVVVAVGAHRSVRLGLEGEGRPGSGVVDGLDLLKAVRTGASVDLGRQVVVAGGGDVAMDCARTAVRLGASVQVLYRRTVREMPALGEELDGARAEGVELVELMAPRRTVLDDGRLVAVECALNRLGEPDASGRRRPVEVPGEGTTVSADTLVVAIGQRPDLSSFGDLRPELTDAGWVQVDTDTMETSLPGVFAGGDLVGDGPATIVQAAADGRRIASEIRRRATGARVGSIGTETSARKIATEREDLVELLRRRGVRRRRVHAPEVSADRRQGFEEVVRTHEPQAAVTEAGRCFECDRMCSICATVCPNRAIVTWQARPRRWRLSQLERRNGQLELGGSLSFAVTQPLQQVVLADWCNECGNCATFCPADGQPFADKPRLVRRREALAEEGPTAIWIGRNGGRWGIEAFESIVGMPDRDRRQADGNGRRSRVRLEDDGRQLCLRGAAFADVEAWLDRDTLEVRAVRGDGALPPQLDLRLAAVLWTLLDGLRRPLAPVVGALPSTEERGQWHLLE
jgi:putative selenate reductase